MKILAIIGSPRRHGNTYQVVKDLEVAMQALGQVSFDYLYLQDAHLEMCRGCFQCLSKGENHCPLQDDRESIVARMAAADGIILASPVYCMTVSALTKNMIDRLAYLFHRPRFFQQDLMVVCTSAGAGLAETNKYLANAQIWGMRSLTKLAIATPLYPSKTLAIDERARTIAKAAQAFYARLTDRRPARVSLMEIIHFLAIRGNATFAPSYFPADLAYYRDQGLLEADYYVPTRNGPALFWLGRLLVKLIGKGFEKRYLGS